MNALKLQATSVTNIKNEEEAAHQLQTIHAIKTIQTRIGLTTQH